MRRLTRLRITDTETGPKVELGGHDISESADEVALLIGRDGVAEAQVTTYSVAEIDVPAEVNIISSASGTAVAEWLRTVNVAELIEATSRGLSEHPIEKAMARLIQMAESKP